MKKYDFLGYSPHHVMLVVAPPMNEASQEHMTLCLTLGLPFFIVVNKIDLGFCSTPETVNQLQSAISTQGYSKQLVMYKDGQIPWDYESDAVPVFNVSCVTGEGLDDLTNFIKNLSPHDVNSTNSDSESCLFQIDETFRYVHMRNVYLEISIQYGLRTGWFFFLLLQGSRFKRTSFGRIARERSDRSWYSITGWAST